MRLCDLLHGCVWAADAAARHALAACFARREVIKDLAQGDMAAGQVLVNRARKQMLVLAKGTLQPSEW